MVTRLLSVAILIAFFAAGCEDKAEIEALRTQVSELQTEKLELQKSKSAMERQLAGATDLISKVDDALDSITKGTSELTLSADSIELGIPRNKQSESKVAMKNIATIEDYIVRSQEDIAELEKKLRGTKEEFSGLKKVAARLRTRLEESEAALAAVKERVTELNKHIDTLEAAIGELQETKRQNEATIESQSERLNAAYYIVAKKKELKALGIVRTTKGLVLFGKSTLLTKDFDTRGFKSIDISKTTEISIPAEVKKVKVMTPQGKDTYRLLSYGKQSLLFIDDPERFWEYSRYLVIMID